jgi:hypothetical protein
VVAGSARRTLVPAAVVASVAIAALVPASALGAGFSFVGATDIAAGDGPEDVAIGDLNGDGRADLVDVARNASIMEVRLGNGDGSFGTARTFSTGTSTGPSRLVLTDRDLDGDLDALVTNFNTANVSVFSGDGRGGFTGGGTVTVGTNPYGLTTGELGGNTRPDVATANSGSSNVSVITQNTVGGGGISTSVTTLAAGTNPDDVTTGDFNGDGRDDVAATNFTSNNAMVWFQQSSGGFATNQPADRTVPLPAQPDSIAALDVNNDGSPDLAAGVSIGQIAIATNDGTGSFSAPTSITSPGRPYALDAADLNGDGRKDLVAANKSSGAMIHLQQGSGGFATSPTQTIGTNQTATGVAVGDVNGDGSADFATANDTSDTLTVGRSVSTPAVTLNPSPTLALGSQSVSTIGSPQTVQVDNGGPGVMRPSRVAVTGANADDFLLSGDTCTGADVAPGGSCALHVRFAPTATGARSALLEVRSNGDPSTAQVTLTGTGAAPPGGPGPAGAQGPAGPPGPAGQQGPAGRDAVVTCRPGRVRRGRVRVTCRVTLVTAGSARRARARLSRGGVTYARGTTQVRGGRAALRMRAIRRIRPARYRLSVVTIDSRGRRALSTRTVIVG